ncbi:transposase [Candidatus Woesearchaeota archaeon]|nr:transposase [Candidatus Woesearchaeota archaeon]
MALKYPNKKKRAGYWKQYERAGIKDYRKVWNFCIELVDEKHIPFQFNELGRKPNLSRKEYVCMSILHAYFDLDFRETEQIIKILTEKQLDHTNCVRWFGKLNQKYVNDLVFKLHKKIIGIDDAGDYIADSTKATCDRLKIVNKAGEDIFYHDTWKLHLLVQYIFTLGVISIVSAFSSEGSVNDSPSLRNKLLHKEKVVEDKKLHADKGYFGKENLEKCKSLGLKPNIVPKDKTEYTEKSISLRSMITIPGKRLGV